MVGSRQMERLLTHAAEAGAKVVLVGDPDQLQAIEAGAAFRALHAQHGGVEITEIRRQLDGWQREATRQLATERTPEALHSYDEHGHVHQAETRAQAREALVERWNVERLAAPDASRIILTHTNEDVRALNGLARGKLSDAGEIGPDVSITTERGSRDFACGDRVMFLKNERSLGVKNGSLGEIEDVTPLRITARLDDGRSVSFDTKDYNQIDHGYAATIHKSQGMTVDRSHVLATPGMDRHSTYVALSRHREGTELHYGRDDFADSDRLARTLSRERAKDMASDYGLGTGVEAGHVREGNGVRASERAPSQNFAARREIKSEVIRLPEPQPRPIEPPKVRSIFASFKPPVVTPERDIAARELRSPSAAPELKRAVEKYARTLNDINAMKERGLPVLPHQEQVRDKARDALNKVQPHAGRDAAHVFRSEPELVSQAASGRSNATMRSMQLEREIQNNPQMRADRFVENWQRLSQQRDNHYRSGNYQAREKVTDQMHGFAKKLERDPQMESILRNRIRELGIHYSQGRGVGDELMRTIGRGLGHGLGM
jgi:hypothetical protein